MFIPFGTIIKSGEDLKKFTGCKQVEIAEKKGQGEHYFYADETFSRYGRIATKEYRVDVEEVREGLKVTSVMKFN